MGHDHDETEEKAWGGAREGAGRTKGKPSLRRAAHAIAEVEEKFPGWSPVLHLAAVANDESLPPEVRLDAAKAAAPFLHSRPKPVEMEPDALVDLERRLIAAKIEETAKAVKLDNTLADRLARAKQRHLASEVFEVFEAMTAAATEVATVIDAQAQPAAQPAAQPVPSPHPTLHEPPAAPDEHAAPAPAAYAPILPRPVPASADWSTPVAAHWPERQASATTDYNPFETEPYRDGLIGSRNS